MGLKLSADEIGYIALFESKTGAVVKDCITDEDKIVFVIKKGDMGLAIGKQGINIQRIRQTMGKQVEVVEFSEKPEEFVKNILHPIRTKNVSLKENTEKKTVVVKVDQRDRAMAIGKGGKNIQKVRFLAARHHAIDDVVIA